MRRHETDSAIMQLYFACLITLCDLHRPVDGLLVITAIKGTVARGDTVRLENRLWELECS
jgi:hypothetical protein